VSGRYRHLLRLTSRTTPAMTAMAITAAGKEKRSSGPPMLGTASTRSCTDAASIADASSRASPPTRPAPSTRSTCKGDDGAAWARSRVSLSAVIPVLESRHGLAAQPARTTAESRAVRARALRSVQRHGSGTSDGRSRRPCRKPAKGSHPALWEVPWKRLRHGEAAGDLIPEGGASRPTSGSSRRPVTREGGGPLCRTLSLSEPSSCLDPLWTRRRLELHGALSARHARPLRQGAAADDRCGHPPDLRCRERRRGA
jgi:hypothetical protein